MITNKNTASRKHWTVRDVFYGYTSEERSSWFITIKSSINLNNSGTLMINYLTLNSDNSIHSFERIFYELEVKKSKNIFLNIFNALPFSLSVASDNLELELEAINKIQLTSYDLNGQQSKKLFLSELDPTIRYWNSLFLESSNNPDRVYNSPMPEISITHEETPNHKFYPATNNIWKQDNLLIGGINDLDANKYYRGDSFVQSRFFRLNNSLTDLHDSITDMTNPYTLEIHKCLNAGFYATNPDDPQQERVANLGHFIEKIANFIGYYPQPDGTTYIDPKTDPLAPKLVGRDFKFDKHDYLIGRFGRKGMLLPWLPNQIKNGKIVDGGYQLIHTLGQLNTSVLDQINHGLNIQESSNLQIEADGKKYSYPNSLGLLVDIARTSKTLASKVEGTYYSSLVTQEQTKEIIGGLGLPVIFKSIRAITQEKGKFKNLPYVAINPNHSIQKEIATCLFNIGRITGQLM